MKSVSFAAATGEKGASADERRARRSQISDLTIGRGRNSLYGNWFDGGEFLCCSSDDPRYRPCHRIIRAGCRSSDPLVSKGILYRSRYGRTSRTRPCHVQYDSQRLGGEGRRVVRKETEYRRAEFARRRAVSVAGQRVFIVSPEDLILSKLDWAKESRSQMQLDDVRNLLRSVQGLDTEYLSRWVDRLGLATLYEEVCQ